MSRPEGLLGGAPNDEVLFDDATAAWWTTEALSGAVRQLVERWRGAMDGERRLVLLRCRNDLATVVGYLAALELRFPVALVDADAAPEHLEALVARYVPGIVAGGTGVVAGTRALDAARADAPASSVSTSPAAPALHPDLAVLLPTSGTTGNAKLVRLSRGALLANADAIADALAIGRHDRAITSLPLQYSYGLSVLNSHLRRGAQVVLTAPNVVAGSFWDVVRTRACTSFAGVPYSYQLLRRLDLSALRVPTLSTLTQAGGRLNPDLVSHFHDLMERRHGRFFVMYGQTEATARMTILPTASLPDKLGTVGRAVPGGRLLVVNEQECAVGPGVIGEVVYEGPNVMMGYAESLADLALGDLHRGHLVTGDLGHLDAEGFLTITGRRKRIAKAFGHRINLDDVEAALAAFPPAAVVCVDDAIVIVGEGWPAELGDTVRQQLAQRYRVHVSAFRVRVAEKLPTLASGKFDYAALERAP